MRGLSFGICTVVLAAAAMGIGILSTVPSIAQGPQGGLTPEQRQAVFGTMTDEERQKFFAMSPEDKGAFIRKKLAEIKDNGATPAAPAAAGGGQGGFAPPLVVLATVGRERLARTFPLTGRVVARQTGMVTSRIQGRISKVNFDVGDRVKEGDILVELDTDRLKLEAELKAAEVIQARARWNAAKAQVDLLNQEVKRLESLQNSAAFSPARLEDRRQEVVKAEAAVDETAAALQRARAARDLARIDLRDASIRAPFPGAVTVRQVSPGAFLNPGSPVAMLLDDLSLEIEADVPAVRITGLEPGMQIDVEIDGTTKLTAEVRAIVPDENPLSRTRAVRFTPKTKNLELPLVANQSVTVHVPQGQPREVIAIPKDAIVNRTDGPAVFVFDGGTVRPVPVSIGESFAGLFEILSGVHEGQKVVVTGNETLRAGQQVRVGGAAGPRSAGQGPADASAGGAAGGSPVGNPAVGALIQSLSDQERQKFFAMSPEEKGMFIRERLAKRDNAGGSGS